MKPTDEANVPIVTAEELATRALDGIRATAGQILVEAGSQRRLERAKLKPSPRQAGREAISPRAVVRRFYSVGKTGTVRSFVDVAEVERSDLHHAVQRAMTKAVDELVAAARFGPILDTTQVTEMLGCSRQAIADRVRRGTIFARPGKGSRSYPAWQFQTSPDPGSSGTFVVRPVVTESLRKLRTFMPDAFSELADGWANSAHTELGGRTAAQWIASGGDDAVLGMIADRVIAELE